jgi:hypothetical protein
VSLQNLRNSNFICNYRNLAYQNGMRKNSCVEYITILDFFEGIKYFETLCYIFLNLTECKMADEKRRNIISCLSATKIINAPEINARWRMKSGAILYRGDMLFVLVCILEDCQILFMDVWECCSSLLTRFF